MKQELKYIEPYLIHGLKIQVTDQTFDGNLPNSIHSVKWVVPYQEKYHWKDNESPDTWTYILNGSGLSFTNHDVKPILRPLSDLTKDVTEEGEVFQICETFALTDENENSLRYLVDGDINVWDLTYEVVTILFENHFAVFGLIPKGLAIDINTL